MKGSRLRRFGLIALVVAGLLLVAAIAFFAWPAKLEAVAPSPAQPTGRALVEKGRYLATAADCVACHSTPNGEPYAGGLAFKLPFGTIYSSNITPDRKNGIGAWSDAEFVRAVRHGVRSDGQQLYPAFPYTAYTHMSTDDVLAIRAYLNTLRPVNQAVAVNQLSFPFNQRYLMRAWKLLFMPRQPLQPDPNQSAEWNRGAYLVEGAGHCAECHTPRNLLFGLKSGQKFAGATTQGWKAYNLTSDPETGIGDWSVDEITRYLATGHTPGRGAAAGSMGEAVSLSLSRLTPQDLRAMAVYLKTIPPKPGTPGSKVNPNPPLMAASTPFAPARAEVGSDAVGLRIFEGACASCHGWDGSGTHSPYGELRGAQTVNDPEATNLVQVILHGSEIRTPQGGASMPSFGRAYNDAEIAAVANYVLRHFGGKAATVTPERVAKARREGE
ncbi:c-type cytochrome [Sphingomonas desiccabilis]|uniref:C-type cytochrome n=1 Tax=Sphingomonas desiccabilis TaxID=429134 RepID=A0A4Q2INX6_9SPHN|nr:c-type cytochrome [Sphingomonas desiccabilis]MBB3911989.1 mono/diheme cytochrome c family protein [Sphingomonas desiccabilis]RXZ31313.1 c-type cytochrome [Sphingomonas desiccabilis]